MAILLNLIWLVFGGVWLALGYLVFGVLACLLVVTIPFGVASFRMASFALWPFGRTVVARPGAGAGSAIGNVIWFLVAGLWLAIGHVTTAAAQAVTIVGIPLALANLKMLPVTVVPFGKQIVPTGQVPAGWVPVYQTGQPGGVAGPGAWGR
ncbi:YccF domain-containing protein [Georgenia sp. TF02-10]|uniref:YccF domain-containing protein n=1 Tax=Georgenia sp. TF02-10 TaxID=2917725 RepID=UPI001FA806AE|nr:YccF domain-containing protein [Georgenia sp. TF02-10]UNX56256.1 YccF domain-containing protein [Georgenia sp. TF02-10]